MGAVIFSSAMRVLLLLILLAREIYCETKSPSSGKKVPIQVKYRPFNFAFQSNDGQGNVQHRREESNGAGQVKGVYGYLDPQGMYRAVEYVADSNGFRAVVKTNEPGTANQNPADTVWVVQPTPVIGVALKKSAPPPTIALKKNIQVSGEQSSGNSLFPPYSTSSKPFVISYPISSARLQKPVSEVSAIEQYSPRDDTTTTNRNKVKIIPRNGNLE